MREEFWRRNVAIAGMGVSGIAVAKAVRDLGGTPVVFDEQPGDIPRVLSAVDQLQAAQIEAVTSWHGHLNEDDFDYLVVSPGFRRDHPAIRDMKNRPILSEVEFAGRIAEAPILAVSGTNGKSTTAVMVWTILRGSGYSARLCGNIAGSGYPEMTLTQAAMEAENDDILVAEVSSYQLEFVSKFRPKVASITNVSPDHSDRHPSFEDYFNTKLRLFDNMGEGDSIVINADEKSVPVTHMRRPLRQGVEFVIFSCEGGGHGETGVTRRKDRELTLGEFKLNIASLPIWGEHNLANLMMAWEMASRIGTLTQGSIAALKEFRGLAHRMEYLGKRNDVQVVNNSMCTNPAAVVASCRAIHAPLHLLMGGNLKNLDFTPVRNYIRGKPHQVYIYGPEPNVLNDMLGGFWPQFVSLPKAFEMAIKNAVPGDTILLAPGCASTSPYSNFIERGEAFKSIAKDWLEK